MAKIPYQNPGSTEVQSPLISGITDGLNKISGMINMETQTDTVNLQEVYVDATDRYRIYEAPQGQKNWLRSPEPIIRKNGNIINPTINFYTIDYVGGSITFAEDARQTSTDEFSAEVTFIVESDLKMPLKADLDPDTKKLISSQIPDTLATKEELKPLQDKLEMDKGYFTDADQLKRTYPVGEVGWHAVVGTTDTVWIWDGDTGAWVNSGTSDINASKVPFTKTTEVDSTNVQDAIEKLGINKANKDLTNVDNAIVKNKGNAAGLAYKDLTNITDITFKQKGDAAGLATKDLANVDNSVFKAKGNTAGLAYKDLTNIVDETLKNKGVQAGLEFLGQCNCTKSGTTFNIIPLSPIPTNKNIMLLYFTAPAYFNKNDTFTVNGTNCSLYVNGTPSQFEIPAGIFNENNIIGMLYNKISNILYFLNPISPFADLSNVKLSDFYNTGIMSGLSIAPGVDYSFNSTTNTYTLKFDTAIGYNLFDNIRTQYVPVTFYNTNPITNSTKFKASDRNGSSIEYVFFIGNQPATSWSSFSLILGSTNLVLDIINKRIYLPISSLFNMDYSQVAYGMQLPVGLRLKNTGNYGSRLRFGDGDLCYLGELADDVLTIHAAEVKIETTRGSTESIMLKSPLNANINMNTVGTGKTLYNNTEVAKVDLSNTTSTQFETKLVNTSNFLNHKCVATKSGTVFTLVVDPAVIIMTSQFAVSFVAPANFNAGDTFSLKFSTGTYSNFVPYLNGKIATKGFMLNDVVTLNVNINSNKVFFRSSAGGLELPADYSEGGIILPDKPEEIQKVTARGTGICPPLSKILFSSYSTNKRIYSKHIYTKDNFVCCIQLDTYNGILTTGKFSLSSISGPAYMVVDNLDGNWYNFDSDNYYGYILIQNDSINSTQIIAWNYYTNSIVYKYNYVDYLFKDISVSGNNNFVYVTDSINGYLLDLEKGPSVSPQIVASGNNNNPVVSVNCSPNNSLVYFDYLKSKGKFFYLDNKNPKEVIVWSSNIIQHIRTISNSSYYAFDLNSKTLYISSFMPGKTPTQIFNFTFDYNIIKVAPTQDDTMIFVFLEGGHIAVLTRATDTIWKKHIYQETSPFNNITDNYTNPDLTLLVNDNYLLLANNKNAWRTTYSDYINNYALY